MAEDTPQRLLIVSATIGEGHNCAGRALEEAARRLWPDCDIRWLDTLAVMGPGIGPLARACYVMQIQCTPWVYEFFFRMIWRHRWFLTSTRQLMGSWCGRRMHRMIRSYRPDLILSTYPLGSAGLSWLREHHRLPVPAGAWVSDFCPHPYWVYRELDLTYVMHPAARPVAERAEPGARVEVGALPVREGFGEGDRAKARAGLGLDQDAFIALVAVGALGFGRADQAVTALLAAAPTVQVVAVCGRNARLRRRLARLGQPPERLRILSWTDDMPGWMRACDIVVTNAGGVTALEALRTGRPVIMFQPIAAHGRANARLMESAGLATCCQAPAELTRIAARLARDPRALKAVAAPAQAVAASARRAEQDLARLWQAAAGAPRALQPVRAEDALFLYAQSASVSQQVGAAVIMDSRVGLPELQAAVTSRVARIPELRRRLVPPWRAGGRPRWELAGRIDAAARITEARLAPGQSLPGLVSEFFSTPLDASRAPWEMLLVQGVGAATGSRSAIVVKLHHALGDSYTLISALSGLFDGAEGLPRPVPGGGAGGLAEVSGRQALTAPSPAGGTARAGRALAGLRRAARTARALTGMACAGQAGPGPFSGPVAGPGRVFVPVRLPARAVTVTARGLGVSPADLVLCLVAEAICGLSGTGGESGGERSVRALVPRTARVTAGPGSSRVAAGNRTAGLLIDLPAGPMPLPERARAIRERRARLLRRGDAEAAAFVLRLMNLMPEAARRAFSRRVYSSRRFSLIVSVFPGVRRRCFVLGAEITEVYPVLALASGVRLAVGAMTWGRWMALGVLADAALAPDATALAGRIQHAFRACQEAVS
jgi:diacylglycerol O-acyltransferase